MVLPGNESSQLLAVDGRHGHRHWLGRRQPIRVVVTAGVVAHVVQVAEQERHRVELLQAAARSAWKIM